MNTATAERLALMADHAQRAIELVTDLNETDAGDTITTEKVNAILYLAADAVAQIRDQLDHAAKPMPAGE